jgi:hypothetical protein
MNYRSSVVRAVAYVAVATVVATAIGYLREGSIGGGLALGMAIGLGVAVGILGFEAVDRWRRS